MAEHTDQSRPSRTMVVERASARVAARFGEGVVKVPSRATAFRVLLLRQMRRGCLVFAAVGLYKGKLRYVNLIICLGQPGRDDLESEDRKSTTYNLVEVSEGCFRGLVKGRDVQDNEDIGSLMHDAWTYWGHSGAPLLREADGRLVGLRQ